MFLAKFIARRQVEGNPCSSPMGPLGAARAIRRSYKPGPGLHAKVAGTVTYLDMRTVTWRCSASLQGQDYARGIQQIKSAGTTLADTEYALLYGVVTPTMLGLGCGIPLGKAKEPMAVALRVDSCGRNAAVLD